MAPQVHELADGAPAAAEVLDANECVGFARSAERDLLGPLGEPFDEQPRFLIAEAARERFVVENQVQQFPIRHPLPQRAVDLRTGAPVLLEGRGYSGGHPLMQPQSDPLWSGLPTRPPRPTEGLHLETFGRQSGTVGRPCHNTGLAASLIPRP